MNQQFCAQPLLHTPGPSVTVSHKARRSQNVGQLQSVEVPAGWQARPAAGAAGVSPIVLVAVQLRLRRVARRRGGARGSAAPCVPPACNDERRVDLIAWPGKGAGAQDGR